MLLLSIFIDFHKLFYSAGHDRLWLYIKHGIPSSSGRIAMKDLPEQKANISIHYTWTRECTGVTTYQL